MDVCLRVLKESNTKEFWQLQSQEQCIDHIPHYLSALSRAHIFLPTTFLEIAVCTYAYYRPLPNEILRTNATDDVYSLGSFIL